MNCSFCVIFAWSKLTKCFLRPDLRSVWCKFSWFFFFFFKPFWLYSGFKGFVKVMVKGFMATNILTAIEGTQHKSKHLNRALPLHPSSSSKLETEMRDTVVSAAFLLQYLHIFCRPQAWFSQQLVWLSSPSTEPLPASPLKAVLQSRVAAILIPPNPSPWLLSCSSSESSAQQRVRRGSGKGWFTQGSRLPCLVSPLFFFLTVSPEHMIRLEPKPLPFYVGLWLESHLSLRCSFLIVNV